MQNAYAPPQSDVEVLPTSAPSKPKAITLLQAIGYLVTAIAAFGLVLGFLQTFDPKRPPAPHNTTLLLLGMRVGLLLGTGTMLFMLHRRSQVGRFLGVGFIALLGIPAVLLLFKNQEGTSTAYLVGWNTFATVLLAAFFYWAYSFGFSTKARAYFRAASPLERAA